MRRNQMIPIPERFSPEYWPELDAAGERASGVRWCKPIAREALEATRMCAGFRELYGDDDIDFKHVCSEELRL